MRSTALGKTALTLGALLATGTAATAGVYLSLASAAQTTANESADSVATQDQLPQSQTSTSAGNQRAQDSGRRTSPSSTRQSPDLTSTPAAQKTTAPAHTKTKGS
jgi:hypothetical protein